MSELLVKVKLEFPTFAQKSPRSLLRTMDYMERGLKEGALNMRKVIL